MAQSEYARGLRKRDNAWKHEKKAAEATSPKRRAKELKKAAADWRDAEKRYRKALEHNPKLHQAHSSLGYALRKQGRYPDSIAAYDRALAIAPRYPEAIEYRAEAYLALDHVRKAVDSYMRLFTLDRKKASQLLTAMEAWLRDTGSDPPSGVTTETLEWFRGWIEGRKEIAARAPAEAARASSW